MTAFNYQAFALAKTAKLQSKTTALCVILIIRNLRRRDDGPFRFGLELVILLTSWTCGEYLLQYSGPVSVRAFQRDTTIIEPRPLSYETCVARTTPHKFPFRGVVKDRQCLALLACKDQLGA